MLTLKDIGQYVVLAEELNFRRAANRLHISQPTLSETVKRIEKALGTTLIVRTTRSSHLTEAGRLLLERGEALLSESEHLETELRAIGTGRLAQLRVGAVYPAMRALVPRALQDTLQKFPRVRVNLQAMVSHAQVRALRGGHLDLGILRTRKPPEGFQSEPLANEPLHLAISNQLAGDNESFDIGDFQDWPLIMTPRKRNPEFYDRILSSFSTYYWNPIEVVEAGDIYSQVALVSAGVGIAMHPRLFIDEERSDIRAVATGYKLDIPLQIVYRKEHYSDAIASLVASTKNQAACIIG
ncbi:LysR family transcriptional regulator [Nesterenkonia ebinurensis]|uniref:LysR family transcriptional regulator n=1 Tax=Nesterenkonia ebinurensis TaxID=2608252 RepID=UPI00123D809C|nr:LysR family transcriptional regulator [Nesterenkonia ebinurensis]